MKQWPHAPVHHLTFQGTYMVTASTYQRTHHFHEPDRLDLLQSLLFDCADTFGWSLQAWAILSNHYHFIAQSPTNPGNLRTFLSKLHTLSAIALNRRDAMPGRKVWFQYWDSRITFQASYLARLKYVHTNPVHHRIAQQAEPYPWCSAGWFAQWASQAFRKTVMSFKTDRINVMDEFEPVAVNTTQQQSGVEPPHAKV
jgi:putative transposase